MLTGVPARFVCFTDGLPNLYYFLCDEVIDGDAVYARTPPPRVPRRRSRDWTLDVSPFWTRCGRHARSPELCKIKGLLGSDS
jgi:hypothetical protein